MKRIVGKVITCIVGGGAGTLLAYPIPVLTALCFERGREMETYLSRFDRFVGGDLLIQLSNMSACIGACFGAWLMTIWFYPMRRNGVPAVIEASEKDI